MDNTEIKESEFECPYCNSQGIEVIKTNTPPDRIFLIRCKCKNCQKEFLKVYHIQYIISLGINQPYHLRVSRVWSQPYIPTKNIARKVKYLVQYRSFIIKWCRWRKYRRYLCCEEVSQGSKCKLLQKYRVGIRVCYKELKTFIRMPCRFESWPAPQT